MQVVMYMVSALFILGGLGGLAWLFLHPSLGCVIWSIVGLAVGLCFFSLSGRYRIKTASAVRRDSRGCGIFLLAVGLSFTGFSLYTLLPYFGGGDGSMALFAAPVFVMGMVIITGGVILMILSRR